jgi:hypothetical protein
MTQCAGSAAVADAMPESAELVARHLKVAASFIAEAEKCLRSCPRKPTRRTIGAALKSLDRLSWAAARAELALARAIDLSRQK